MEKAIYISDLHFEHVSWNSGLSFQKDELAIFQKRLEEIAPRYTSTEILSQVEHFQNTFIRHHEVIDILLHDIKLHEQELSTYAQEHPIAVDHVHFTDHTTLRDRVETQDSMYKSLKAEFMRFLTETM